MSDTVVGVQGKGAADLRGIQLGAFCIVQTDANGVDVQFQTQSCGGQNILLFGFCYCGDNAGQTNAFAFEQTVQTVFPSGGLQNVGFFSQFLVKGNAYADNFIGNEGYLDVCVVGMEQKRAVEAVQTDNLRTNIHSLLLQ